MYRFLSYPELFGESWLSIDISVSVAASESEFLTHLHFCLICSKQPE